jgi:hypothetical protein
MSRRLSGGKSDDRQKLKQWLAAAEAAGWKKHPSKTGWMLLDPTGVHHVGVHTTYSDRRSLMNLRARFKRAGLDVEAPFVKEKKPMPEQMPLELIERPVVDNAIEPVGEVREMGSKGRKPTAHFVQEALRAHVDREVTSTIIVNWVRRERSASLNASSVSGVMARICNGQLESEVKLERLSLGVYHVHLSGLATSAPEQAPAERAGLKAGELLEIVHVAMDGRVYASDSAGSLYRITPITG